MATMAHTDDSSPLLTPESTAVAGPPVAADSAISCTGLVSVDVKYSVMRDAICASTRPPTTAPNMRQPTLEIEPPFGLPTYTRANTSVPMIVRTPAVRKPRLIGAIALLSLSVARTANTPTIDASTPIARAPSGKSAPAAHSAGWCGKIAANAGTPRMIDATSVTSYDSNKSAAIPAQSPTLSPTLSAMVGGLRGSSSGIPASTLPTRSAPTSAALVKMPPPTRRKSASNEPPKPKPMRIADAVFWKIMMINVAPSRPRPTVNMPATPPVRNATLSAAGNEPDRAAAAVRTLPRTARLMPMNPVSPESTHPATNASVRNRPDCTKVRPDDALGPASSGFVTSVEVTNTTIASGM